MVATSSPVPDRRAKRVLDKTVSGALLVVLAPAIAAITAAMGIDMLVEPRDRGALLYRERRISRGREFDLLKFRTLRTDVLEEMRRDGGHVRMYEADPATLTWAGRVVLKPCYLDEVPQLWNVLRGQMSLVGPRPWPPMLVERQVERGHDYRLRMTAGWTGPAQVRKTEPGGTGLDLAYEKACLTASGPSLVRLDLRILRDTVRLMLRGEGLRY